MLPQSTLNEVNNFLAQIQNTTIEDFEIIDREKHAAYETAKSARPLIKLSAADFSWLNKRVRDTVRPLLLNLQWPRLSLKSIVNVYISTAAQAIVRRDRLSVEQYEAYVGGFRQVGVNVPPHPSQVNDTPDNR